MGKLHRDIKPSNVMVGWTGRVVVLDLGLSTELRGEDDPQKTEHLVVGTIPYMAPEQGAELSLTPASDWYSVGVMLYRVLTGRMPYTGTRLELMTRKQLEDPPHPASIVEGLPVIGTILYARVPSGVGVLTAGIILAIMIVPFVASIARDIFDQIPTILRESAYGIGCTTWEVVRHVLLPQAGVSVIGAVMLGLGRALGETMAVTFVIGNANRLSLSVFDPGSTIASRIANEFNEAVGLQLNALMALGCILFLVTFVVLAVARVLIARAARS